MVRAWFEMVDPSISVQEDESVLCNSFIYYTKLAVGSTQPAGSFWSFHVLPMLVWISLMHSDFFLKHAD